MKLSMEKIQELTNEVDKWKVEVKTSKDRLEGEVQ